MRFPVQKFGENLTEADGALLFSCEISLVSNIILMSISSTLYTIKVSSSFFALTFSTLSLNISSATSCSIKVLKLLTALLKFIVIAPATTNVKTTINFKRYLIALFVLSPAKIWYCSIFFIDIIILFQNDIFCSSTFVSPLYFINSHSFFCIFYYKTFFFYFISYFI